MKHIKTFESINDEYEKVFYEFVENKGKYIVFIDSFHRNEITIGVVGDISSKNYYVDIFGVGVRYGAYHMMNIEVFGFCDNLECAEELKKDIELKKDAKKYNL